MIITELKVLGREVVLEYEPQSSWRSWGLEREGEYDAHLFLGKFSLVRTIHWRNESRGATRMAAALLGLLLAASMASAVGAAIWATITSTPSPRS